MKWLNRLLNRTPAQDAAATAAPPGVSPLRTKAPPLSLSYSDEGKAALDSNDFARAADCFRLVCTADPTNPDGFVNLAYCLIELGGGPEAEQAVSRALQLAPKNADTHYLSGLLARLQGDVRAEAAAFARALDLRPSFVAAASDACQAWARLGEFAEAERMLRRSMREAPGVADLHFFLGNLQTLQNLVGEACVSYRDGLLLAPDHQGCHLGLAGLYRRNGEFALAAQHFEKVALRGAAEATIHNDFAYTLQQLGRFKEALHHGTLALERDPSLSGAYVNRGNALFELGQTQAALENFDRAITLAPQLVEAHCNRGAVLQDMGRLDDSIASYQRALALQPGHQGAFDNLLFTLNYHPHKTAAEIFEAYRAYEERFGAALRRTWRPHRNVRASGRKLRIGYVSPDFRFHSVALFLEPLWARHDRSRFEVFAYSETARHDAVTKRLRSHTTHWVETAGLTDEALAERIRADEIDVLVDLAGHTGGNRLPVFARKPAPVSVSWLGFGYTTGLRAIDYLLTDPVSAPEGSEPSFSAALWRSSSVPYVYRPPKNIGVRSPLPARSRGYVTFGTLTRAVRINDRTLHTWSRLLVAVPTARLIINSKSYQDPSVCQDLRARFEAQGIDPKRIDLGFDSPPWDLLKKIDISLDCFPHNSGTTLFESLFLGIPYITLAERPSVGRLGGAILHAVQRSEWIAQTEEDYVEKAAALAGDWDALELCRAELSNAFASGPLMDEEGFARRIEQAYEEMWTLWCRQPAESELASNAHQPDDAATLLEAARELLSLGRPTDALATVDRALEINANEASALHLRGSILVACSRLEEARASYEAALSKSPELVESWSNHAIVCQRLGDLDTALASARRAVLLQPDFRDGILNLAVVLHAMQRCAEAASTLREGLVHFPSDPELHWNLAINSLLLGDFALGWPEHEWRWHATKQARPSFSEPMWSGQEELRGKRILLVPEQGLGDTLQMLRYVPLLSERGADVVLVVPPPLAELARTSLPACRVLQSNEPVPRIDFYCPLLSLPLAFKTSETSVPADIPYLRCPSVPIEQWAEKLVPRKKPRIGLVWAGNPEHFNDGNRSVALELLLNLRSEHYDVVSLQKDVREGDRKALHEWPELKSFGPDFRSFTDTAALIMNVDVVISVDTSVAHLAGALGRPLWLLLPYHPDWRWMLARSDSPWYPTARLFRQDIRRSWPLVIDVVREELEKLFAPF